MLLKEKEDQLILTDRAGIVWVFASLFVFVGGAILYGSLGGFTDWNETSGLVLAISAFMGAVGLAAGLYFIISTPFSRVIINRQSRTLMHRRRGLLKTEERIVRFLDAAEFFLHDEKDNDGDMYYRVDLRLKSGEEIRLTEVSDPDRATKEELILRLNRYIC